MGVILLLVMIGVPILEIAVFIEVGGRIGVWPTVGTVVLTAMIGTALLRHQGLATLFKAQENLNRGVLPMAEVFDGLCLVLAGALLLTPGFVTDAVGFLLFVPPFRAWLGAVIARWLTESGRATTFTAGPGPGPSGPHGPGGPSPWAGGGTVIDGEFEDVTEDDPSPGPSLPNSRDRK